MGDVDLTKIPVPDVRYVLRCRMIAGVLHFYVYDLELKERVSFHMESFHRCWDRAIYLNHTLDAPKGRFGSGGNNADITYEKMILGVGND